MPDSQPTTPAEARPAELDPLIVEARARRGLRISIADGFFYVLMVGVSESYLGPMAVELGHRDTALAVLLTLPMVAGSFAQLLSGPLAALLGSRKRLVVTFAALQALSLLGLWLVATYGVRALWPLLLVDTIYFVCAMIVGPPWGAWMAALTEGRERERYFAHRTAIVYAGLLIAYVGAGVLLQGAAGDLAAKLRAFAILHVLGFAFRALSTSLLAAQPDIETSRRTIAESFAAVRAAAATADFRVARYLALLMLGASVGVPFFTPYMLRDLGLDYATYAGLTAVPIAIKALLMPALHPLCERFGMRRVLVWSGIGAVITPALWVLTRDTPGLAAIQVLSGLSWGALEYTSYQLLLSSSREDCRVEFLSIATTLSSSAQLLGGLLGSALRERWAVPYTTLFLLSALGRAAALPWITEVTPARLRRELPRLFLRFIAVRPADGTLARPIVSDAPPPPSAPSSELGREHDYDAATRDSR